MKEYTFFEKVKIAKDYFQITVNEAEEFVKEEKSHMTNEDYETMENANNKMESLRNDYRVNRFNNPYTRTRNAVYATGNKWAIENFNATH